MKNISRFMACAAVLVLFALVTPHGMASTIAIDFGTSTSPLQSGFTAQSSGSAVYSTVAGDITVATDGSFFNRSATGTYTDASLLGDFLYKNNLTTNTLTITINGAGIAANTGYEIRFYSYDSQHGSGGGTVTYDGISGTLGSAVINYSNAGANDPGFALSNSDLATFTSDVSGNITIGVTGTNEGPRVSGMEITVIPEPSTGILALFTGALLTLRRRR